MVYSLRPQEQDPCKGSWAMVARSYDTRRELLGRARPPLIQGQESDGREKDLCQWRRRLLETKAELKEAPSGYAQHETKKRKKVEWKVKAS